MGHCSNCGSGLNEYSEVCYGCGRPVQPRWVYYMEDACHESCISSSEPSTTRELTPEEAQQLMEAKRLKEIREKKGERILYIISGALIVIQILISCVLAKSFWEGVLIFVVLLIVPVSPILTVLHFFIELIYGLPEDSILNDKVKRRR